MSWRSVQLGKKFCEQDHVIIDLFKDQSVCYVGPDSEFASVLSHDCMSENLVLIINSEVWCSDIQKLCATYLTNEIKKFYIGINRYRILGNDTNCCFESSENFGDNIIKMIQYFLEPLNFYISTQGTHDRDQGRYFNFVQPLTWMYGIKKTN